jgi:hypothetical protein
MRSPQLYPRTLERVVDHASPSADLVADPLAGPASPVEVDDEGDLVSLWALLANRYAMGSQ